MSTLDIDFDRKKSLIGPGSYEVTIGSPLHKKKASAPFLSKSKRNAFDP